ncbi:putative 26S proteasome regulatory subunit [Kockovaella imperatae]|uniref:Putative 26S proteasome regulatory subunit n=1 Tax=Kockovaella imperatae TaxID=4999 RepID=A0A1Y1UFV1_9TREE|nr:putative 26S proteasome regulatory subunit [Kockovaella imperatae]ORX36849.1 putative 26S proteasome regulatory subunit [Kockovaella imperatae]
MSSAPGKDSKATNGATEEHKGDVESEVKVVPKITPEDEVLHHLTLIARGVTNMEPRFVIRVLRTLTTTRKKTSKKVLRTVLEKAYPSGSKTGQSLIASAVFQSLPDESAPELDSAGADTEMDVDAALKDVSKTDSSEPPKAVQPKKFSPPTDASGDLVVEGTVYLRLLLLLKAIDAKHIDEAQQFALDTIELINKANKRSLDQLAAKAYFYLARVYELQGKLSDLRSTLLAARQTASLRKDETLEVTVINLLLRSYLADKQYDQADKLIAKSTFQGQVNQAQSVRWLFYAGRLRAIQLNYTKAREYFQTAIRRAPKDDVAPGFVQIIHKYFIVVVLLTGVIPERSMFRKPVLRDALVPYFQIVQAVRVGDVTAFQKAFKEHEATFLADSTHFLILRLRHFVIKTALRTITLAYSRISLADVCIKLHLDSEEDTEYIVAKAIKDGVIDATIDHVEGYMQSRVARDMYETEEPAKQFNRRVEHLTGLYNETVRAMRYPPNAHRKELDNAAETRERDREIAQMIQDNDVDDDDMDDL